MDGHQTPGVLDQICDSTFQTVVKNLLKGYLVVGGVAYAQAAHARRGYGVDLVWDLWNEQFSAFTYPLIATAYPTLAAGVSVYAGAGIGLHSDVHQAWSGQFTVWEGSIEVAIWKFLALEGQVGYFYSPGNATVGGVAGVTGSASIPALNHIISLPLGASFSHAIDHWTPCDPITRRLHNVRIQGSHLRKMSKVDVHGSHGADHGGGHDSHDSHSSHAPAVSEHSARSGHGSSHASHGGHHGAKSYFGIDLSRAKWGVPRHLEHVLGLTNPLLPGFALAASAVSMTKEYMNANGMLESGREAGFDEMHRWACSEPYRLIRRYTSEVPTGTDQREYDNNRYTVQRTNNNKYLITSSLGANPTGAWSTTMRLHNPDASYAGVPAVTYRVAGARAPNGFINGRSYTMMRFSDKLMEHRTQMMNR